MVKVHVVVLCTGTTVLSRALASFKWQTYKNMTLHVVNVGGDILDVTPAIEIWEEDIRIYNLENINPDQVTENISNGLCLFFAPDCLYMPWHVAKMVTGWIDCGKKAYTATRGLSRSHEVGASLFYTTRASKLYNTIFQAAHVQQVNGIPHGLYNLIDTINVENQIQQSAGTECPSIFYDDAPITTAKEDVGLYMADYGMQLQEFQNVLNNGITILEDLTPRDENGNPFPHEMTTRNTAEIEDVKRWVPRPLACVCVISDDTYHSWQVLVMLHNFRKYGYSSCMRLLVYYQYSHPNPIFIKAMEHFPEVSVFYYKDKNADMAAYKSVMRPHVLKQHWAEYPFLKHYAIFYHDSDIVFTKDPQLHTLTTGPACFTGDTLGYIGAKSYLTHKDMGPHGRELLEQMAGVVGIDPDLLLAKDAQSGGAQYILKDVDATYWAKVEKDSVILNLCMLRLNRDLLNPSTPDEKRQKGELTHVQAWCADMWAVLWNLWLREKDTPISPNISHSWGTDPIHRWEEFAIHHNAGVTQADFFNHKVFAKWKYVDKWPHSIDLQEFNNSFCSYNYAVEIKEFFSWFDTQKKE